MKATEDTTLMRLFRAIVADDGATVTKLLEKSAALAKQALETGASRQEPEEFFFEEIRHHLYAGDTALHVAAAGYRLEIARQLMERGADVRAANRRGAEALHYASDGRPDAPHWKPEAQAKMIGLLVSRGADANALDKSGVAPLHRAVRSRCLAAVDALLRNGADAGQRNKSGSTPLHLAVQNTGASSSGTAEAKAQQEEIILRLLKAGADPEARDGAGKTVRQAINSDWIERLIP